MNRTLHARGGGTPCSATDECIWVDGHKGDCTIPFPDHDLGCRLPNDHSGGCGPAEPA